MPPKKKNTRGGRKGKGKAAKKPAPKAAAKQKRKKLVMKDARIKGLDVAHFYASSIQHDSEGKAVAAALVDEEQYQDITPDVSDASDEEARRGEAVSRKANKDKLANMPQLDKSVKVGKKARKEKDIPVTSIPQIRENMDELAEWIRGYEFLYNLGHMEHKDTKKKLSLYNDKAKEMMEANPTLGEVTGKYHDCVEFC